MNTLRFASFLSSAALAMALMVTPALAAGTNGSFESGTAPGTFLTVTAPNAVDITDWSVDTGSVDYIGSYWGASNGTRSIDLNGTEAAAISQTIPTIIGDTYTVTFDLSGNPDSRPENDVYFSPTAKVVQVSATGGVPQTYTYDTAVEGNNLGDMKWATGKTYTFVATGVSTTLSFASQIPGAFGPVIDNVVIVETAPACNAQAAHDVVSDATTYNTTDSMYAVLLTFIHPAWDAAISGAQWIWATDPVQTVPETDVTKTFTKTFTIVGTPSAGTLYVAADNNYTAKVNGNVVPVVFDQNNFQAGTQDAYDVTPFLVTGSNTIEITATNWGVGQSTDPAANPAGVMFKLSFTSNECVVPPPATGSLMVTKNTVGGDGTFTFTGVGNGFSITTTAGTGAVTLPNLAPGNYTVTETAQSGWTMNTSTCTNVAVVANQTATCTVTNTMQSSISGSKFNDLNRNGKWDTGEPGLQGWVIRLLLDGPRETHTLIATATTDANGNYTFANVAPGTYDVRETHQKGWKRITKNPKDIIITTGSIVTGVTFGNATKLKKEDEDNDKDDNRKDQDGHYYGNHGKSDYSKEDSKNGHDRDGGNRH